MSVSIGPEFNYNSEEYFAGGFVFAIDYQLPVSPLRLAIGLTTTYSYDFGETTTLETAGSFRWYFIDDIVPGLFAQIDLGAHIITENEITHTSFNAGLRAGYRFPFTASFYIEPYGRFGYPFFLGAGLLAGASFDLSSGNTSREPRAPRAPRTPGNTSSNVDSDSEGDE